MANPFFNFDFNKLKPRLRIRRGKPHWLVKQHWVVGPGEKRSRMFKCKEAAEQHVKSLMARIEALGRTALQLTERDLIRFVESKCRLADANSNILEATEHFMQTKNKPEQHATLRWICARHLKSLKLRGSSDKSLEEYASKMRRTCAVLGDQPISQLSVIKVEDWLNGLDVGRRTRIGYARYVRTALNFANDRGIDTIRLPKSLFASSVADSEPGILAPDQIRKLLIVCHEVGQPLPTMVALQAFTGIRRSELCCLDWADFHWEDEVIKVPAKKSKTRQNRFVPIRSTLASWLDLIPRQTQGPVGFRKPDAYSSRLKKCILAAGIHPWPHNALRHSFASYRLAGGATERQVAMEMGNTPEVLINHYRQLVTSQAATEFWNLSPDQVLKNRNSSQFSRPVHSNTNTQKTNV